MFHRRGENIPERVLPSGREKAREGLARGTTPSRFKAVAKWRRRCRRFHADWLGVGGKELCRRVVSRQPVRGGRFRACAHNPCLSLPLPFDPLSPSSPPILAARYYSRFLLVDVRARLGVIEIFVSDIPDDDFIRFVTLLVI